MATVLIVDDSKTSILIIGEIVKKLGHEVIGQAEDGELGVEAYKKLNPDLVLADIEMPKLNGYEMAKKIIEFDPDAAIAMVTSVVNAQFIKRVINIGVIDAIKKPVNEVKLEKIFNKLNL